MRVREGPVAPAFSTTSPPSRRPGLRSAGSMHETRPSEASAVAAGGACAPSYTTWALQDSNLGTSGYEPAALTAELRAPAHVTAPAAPSRTFSVQREVARSRSTSRLASARPMPCCWRASLMASITSPAAASCSMLSSATAASGGLANCLADRVRDLGLLALVRVHAIGEPQLARFRHQRPRSRPGTSRARGDSKLRSWRTRSATSDDLAERELPGTPPEQVGAPPAQALLGEVELEADALEERRSREGKQRAQAAEQQPGIVARLLEPDGSQHRCAEGGQQQAQPERVGRDHQRPIRLSFRAHASSASPGRAGKLRGARYHAARRCRVPRPAIASP